MKLLSISVCLKQCISGYEMTLAEGLRFERRIFHGLFATKDQKEGEHMVLSCQGYC